jgi:hypothetical protein
MRRYAISSLALALLAFCMAVGPANAQGLYGKFTVKSAW